MEAPMYALQGVPGKGKGLVSTRKISKGTRILSEEPVISLGETLSQIQLKSSIRRQVDALEKRQRQSFLSMNSIYPYGDAVEQYIGIFRTNSLPADVGGDEGAIFIDACRINHACDNNAQKDWNEKTRRHTVHALKDIEEGEEITITYLAPLKNRNERHKVLLERFGFVCACHLCSLPPKESQESDKRLEEIRRLDDAINYGFVRNSAVQTLQYLGPAGAAIQRTRTGGCWFRIECIANSDLARGRAFMERAAHVWTTILGDDSEQAIETGALARDPSKQNIPIASTRWKTNVDEIPQGLEPSTFDEWLWRREKLRVPGQVSGLRSRTTFPGFVELPKRGGIDTGGTRQHWCFLGEIVDFSTIHHLEIGLKDIDDREVPLHFYTDGRGDEMTPSQLHEGFTVTVLDAKRHVFVFGPPGIRHEDPQMLKVMAARQFNFSASLANRT